MLTLPLARLAWANLTNNARPGFFVLQNLVCHLSAVNINLARELESNPNPIALDHRYANDAQRGGGVSDHYFFSLSTGDHKHGGIASCMRLADQGERFAFHSVSRPFLVAFVANSGIVPRALQA